MDVVRSTRQSAAPPLALVVALFMVLAIIAGGWYATHRIAPATTRGGSVAVTTTGYGPDAGDRNAEILAARLGRAEANHGH